MRKCVTSAPPRLRVKKNRPRRKDSGYALLLVLLMGAVIAITLYMEIPRIAFDSQRQKEQLLIERGEQYKRAIQLFVKANNRWPGRIEDLESFNNRHYLRKRFKDPMTGKDEWRLINIQNGILTNSVTTKQNAGNQQAAASFGSYVGVQPGMGETSPGSGQGGANLAMRPRGSDRMPGGMGAEQIPPVGGEPPLPGQPQQIPGQPGMPQGMPGQIGFPTGQPNFPAQGGLQPGQPGFPNQPGLPPGQPGFQPGQPGQPGFQPNPRVFQPGQPVFQPGQPGFPAQPGFQIPGQPGSPAFGRGGAGMPVGIPGNNPGTSTGNTSGGGSYVGGGGSYVGGGSYIGGQATTPSLPQGGGQMVTPMLPPQPGSPVNSQIGGVSPYPISPGASGQPPNFPQPGMQMGQQPPNAAAQMISQILTTPRPGGQPQSTPGGIIGAGIAGVASNAESDSIMIYADRTNYGEWEFIFDPMKQKIPPNPLTGQIGNPAATLGPAAGQIQPGNQNQTPFGGPQGPGTQQQQQPMPPGFPPPFGGQTPALPGRR